MNLPTLEELRAEKARRHLLDFVPWATPKYARPVHLLPLVDLLERVFIKREQVNAVVAAPPRFAKSETTWHGIVHALRFWWPEALIGYAGYGLRLPRSIARKARDKYVAIGGQLGSVALADEWRTHAGGGMLAGGIRGAFTGFGLQVGIVDDPFKGRLEAESPIIRQATQDWFDGTFFQRIEPGGSCIVFATRWHEDDLSGYLIREGWENINMPAVSTVDGVEQSLWPERWTLEELAKKRKRGGEYNWHSVYMGQPRSREGKLFNPSKLGTYSELPRNIRGFAFGVDLAYSAKTSSDYSSAVGFALGYDGKKYLIAVKRRQCKVTRFKKVCRFLHRKFPRARWRWYASTTEHGTADLFNEGPRPVPLEAELARGDKFVRAQAYAADWEAGNILVPEDTAAFGEDVLDEWIAEHAAFTGKDGGTDDQVDASVPASDLLDESAGSDLEIPTKVPPAPRHGVGALEH